MAWREVKITPESLEGFATVEEDVTAWQEAIRTQLSDHGMSWAEFAREFVRYAEPRIPDRSTEDVREKLGELTQVAMDLIWRGTNEVDSDTDDLQLRAAQAVRDVYKLLPEEVTHG